MKIIKNILLIFIIIILLSRCKRSNNRVLIPKEPESNIVSSSTVEDNSKDDNVISQKNWQKEYKGFLLNYTANQDVYPPIFFLRSLDDDDIAELIIVQQKELGESNIILKIYSYDKGIYYIGTSTDVKTGAGFFISDNSKFNGMFTMKWGGGIEDYSYFFVKDRELLHEYLWSINRTGDAPIQRNISDNEELINESIYLHNLIDYENHLLKSY